MKHLQPLTRLAPPLLALFALQLVGLEGAAIAGNVPETPPPAAEATPPPPPTSTGGQALPAGHPPLGGMPKGHPAMPGSTGAAAPAGAFELPPVAPGAGQGAAALVWQTPEGWVVEAPANPMRRAQLRVPGVGGDGECIVFYFGPGQGGDPKGNAERWAGQFSQPDGRPALAAMKTSTIDVAGLEVLLVETSGNYQAGGMMGGMPASRTDWALLGAVAKGPDANWFFKLIGPRATIEAQRAAFESMIRSLRRGS